ncbi:c-type cytochrome [Ramlibacter sp. XY19]|uniref:c-type cytochrome n=1 Tax=Ramlibacter paludis TaxID=2908000 RepID=UPI0023DA34A3|nr:c-type cytochrome [Ramlibacter paludis]MCG2591924.1 c-type cytochrome [Ramlibacter paludis]
MVKGAASLLACATALALLLAAPQAGGQAKKAPAARPASAAKAPAPDYAARFAGLCAACHGPQGRSELAPVLAGQPSLYAATQLFLFREGRRSNEAMTAVAKTLSDDDLRGFSDYIGTLPAVPPPAPATPPDAARMAKGRALAEQHKCVFCHGADLAGGQQVPRIAGQHEDYLRESLRGFHSGGRPGYTQAMTAAVSQVPVEDLDLLAWYAARR